MKRYLKFELDGQFISRKDNITPVAKSRNYFYAHFDFMTPEWTGQKTALFTLKDNPRSAILDEQGDCLIPWEFFDTDHEAVGSVSVFCGDLKTANEAYVRILKSGYRESDASVPPSPDVYQQILDRLDSLEPPNYTMISGGTFADWKGGNGNGD